MEISRVTTGNIIRVTCTYDDGTKGYTVESSSSGRIVGTLGTSWKDSEISEMWDYLEKGVRVLQPFKEEV